MIRCNCFSSLIRFIPPQVLKTGSLVCSSRFHHDLTGDRKRPLKTKWKLANGEAKDIKAYVGQTLLEVAHENDLPVEGACGGVCACSTCHVYLTEEAYETFPEATEKEEDMLDVAFFPTPTSRLGCQLVLTEEHDNLEIELPKATRNMAVDGYVSKPH